MKSITGQIFSFTRQTTHTQSKSAPIQKFTTQQPLSDAQKRLRWLDISVVKNNGRAFEADQNLIVAKDAIFFPPVKCTNLHGIEKTFPDDAGARLKLMSFSFKHYGAGLVKAWTKPFNATLEKSNLPLAAKIDTFEICFIEYTFLAMAKGVFINSLKSKTPDNLQATTGFSFGGVRVRLIKQSAKLDRINL